MASAIRYSDYVLAPQILVEKCDGNSLVVWLPRGSADGCLIWERILTVSLEAVPVGPFRTVAAVLETVREEKPASWFSFWFGKERAAADSVTRIVPGGKSGRVEQRRRDVILAFASDEQDFDSALVKNFSVAERRESLGPRLSVVIGVARSHGGKIIGDRTIKDAGLHTELLAPTGLVPPTAVVSRDVAPTPAPDPSSLRVIRVFVSSTFRDMKAERAYLAANIFPQLRKLCETRGLVWNAVEFRWGITEDEKEEKQVLPICLREVSRCDYFLGLLGERYGWIPKPEDWTPRDFERHLWVKDYPDRSLTELEIAHGVLREPHSARHAFFYFRDPAILDRLPEGVSAADFRSESPAAEVAVGRLKGEIRQARERGACELRDEPFRTVEELGGWVLADFGKLIDRLYPHDQVVAETQRDLDVHEAHARSRARVYVKRESDFDRLDRHVAGNDPPLVVLGESGLGKSALLANYFLHERERRDGDFALIHFIGCTPDSADEVALMRRIMCELKRHFQLPDEVPFMPNQIRDTFRQWLEHGARRGRILLILDGLNQIQDVGRALDLDWLPTDLPVGCRVILSTLPGRPLEAIRRRNWPTHELKALSRDERRALVRDYLRDDARKLGPERIEQVTSAEQTANPLFLRTMLDELRRFADHDELATRIPEYLSARNPRELLVLLLERWNRHFGGEVIARSLSLLWASRHGLAEVELLELLGAHKDRTIPLLWSQFFYATEALFVQRCGLLGFAHDFMRAAVEAAFLPDEKQRRARHAQLATYFDHHRKSHFSERMLDEVTWQYFHNCDWASLKNLLVDREIFVRRRSTERGKTELQQYWMALIDHFDPEAAYAQAAKDWERQAGVGGDLAVACAHLGLFHLERAEFEFAEPQMRRALAVLEQLDGSEHPTVAAALGNLARLLKETNRQTEAELLMRRALVINERSYGANHPATATDMSDLAVLLVQLDRLAEAESLMRRVLAIVEEQYGADHPKVASALNNLAALLQTTNRCEESEPLLYRALAIYESSQGKDHPDIASVLNNLSHLLQSTNRSADAEPLLRRTVAVKEQFYGAEHPDVALSLNNLAALLYAAKRWQEAEPLMFRAVAVYERSLGADHPVVARSLTNLAALHLAADRLEEAERLIRRALAIHKQCGLEDHPDNVPAFNLLGQVLMGSKRQAEAEPIMRRPVEAYLAFTRKVGHPHPYLQVSLSNYSALLRAMGMSEVEIDERLKAFSP